MIVDLLIVLVLLGLGIRLAFGLRRPHFWLFSGLMALVGLPAIVAIILISSMR